MPDQSSWSSQLLSAVEAAEPVAAVHVFARELGREIGADQVSLLIADFSGRSLVRLIRAPDQGPREHEPRRSR